MNPVAAFGSLLGYCCPDTKDQTIAGRRVGRTTDNVISRRRSSVPHVTPPIEAPRPAAKKLCCLSLTDRKAMETFISELFEGDLRLLCVIARASLTYSSQNPVLKGSTKIFKNVKEGLKDTLSTCADEIQKNFKAVPLKGGVEGYTDFNQGKKGSLFFQDMIKCKIKEVFNENGIHVKKVGANLSLDKVKGYSLSQDIPIITLCFPNTVSRGSSRITSYARETRVELDLQKALTGEIRKGPFQVQVKSYQDLRKIVSSLNSEGSFSDKRASLGRYFYSGKFNGEFKSESYLQQPGFHDAQPFYPKGFRQEITKLWKRGIL